MTNILVPFLAGIAGFDLFQGFPVSVLLILIVISLCYLKAGRPFAIIIIVATFFYASLRSPVEVSPFRCDGSVIEGTTGAVSERTDHRYSTVMRLRSVNRCGEDIEGREIRIFSSQQFPPGSEVVILADVKGTYSYRNPYNHERDLWINASTKEIYSIRESRGVRSKIDRARHRILSFFESNFDPARAGFLSAVVIGEKGGIDESTRSSFAHAGLSHLLAISGVHFGIFSFLVFGVFRAVLLSIPSRFLASVTLHILPSQLAAFLSLPFMVLYLLLSGAGLPAIRSFVMINVFLLGLLLGRKGEWKSSVSVAAVVVLLISPGSVFDLSFMLSFIAVVSIGYALQWYDEITRLPVPVNEKKSLKDRAVKWAVITLIVTMSANIGTLPVVLYYFHFTSLISPLANLIIAPAVCFILIPHAVLGSVIYLITGLFPMPALLDTTAGSLLFILELMQNIKGVRVPFADFPVIYPIIFYAGGIMMLVVRSRKLSLPVMASGLVLMLTAGTWHGGSLDITFLDAGQAESAVLRFPDDKVMVIDTGKSGRQTRRFLDHMGTDVVDHLVISHQGYDHAGGADEVISTKTVEKVYDNGMISYPDGYLGKAGLSHLGRGDIINGEGYTLEVLHPYKGFYTSFGSPSSSDNNSSLVLRLRYHGVAVLFTGDIEAEAEDDLISTGEYLRSDIIKIPHHGSSTSSSSAFVNAVSPSVAVISSGMFNPYGHPHKRTIDNLEGVRIINTSEAGAVKVSVGGDSDSAVISIKTYESERIGSADSLQDELENIIKLFSVW